LTVSQNFWIDGKPYWPGIQLDEVAFPVILAWRLKLENALQRFDPYPMVLRAAAYLVRHGPVTPKERWEEVSGYSPSTLASNIAALICAACFARERGDEATAIIDDLEGRSQTSLVDFLRAQLLTAEKCYPEALAALERVTEADLLRPGLFLQTADLYLRLGRWRAALQVYERALAIDPDNAYAHIGVCRIALRRRKFSAAAHFALNALQRLHHYPLAHFLLGLALTGMQECERAADAFRAAICFNPNFPEAHFKLAALLEKHFGDAETAHEHRRLARRMRTRSSIPASGRRGRRRRCGPRLRRLATNPAPCRACCTQV
jgi:tetratricopeptide (TPR) repeat protein